jgi:hypothetical protein
MDPIVGDVLMGVGNPLIISALVVLLVKERNKMKALVLKKEILELELKKEEKKLLSLIEENKRYDRLINEENQK